MPTRIVECVPNFSEGRDPAKVDEIAAAIGRGPDIAILGKTMDVDHNRSVITFAGSPEAVAEAALRAVAKSSELIDLNHHVGVHPRIGATDVLPFVPVEGVTMADCVALAIDVAQQIWRRLEIPVYLYEEAARRPERKRLENIRRGQFEGLRSLVRTDPDRRADIGGPELHPTAGAVVVGARQFLIAYNINLESEDVSVAKAIAKKIRTSSGGFPNVKALGLPLTARGQTQVSMNLTDFRTTPVHVVYDAVSREAEALGVNIAESELIGLIPKAALETTAQKYLRLENFSPDMVLETRLAELLPHSVDDVLEELSDPARSAGGGSAAALAGALSAALGMLTGRLMKVNPEPFAQHRMFFRAASDRDAEAFAGLMHTTDAALEALVEATIVPLEIAERAAVLHEELRQLVADCPPAYGSDLATAIGLANAAKIGAISTVELNLARVPEESHIAAMKHAMKERLETLR